MDHIAHIKNTGGLDNESVTEEKVSEHCKKVALLTRSYSAPLNLENTVKELIDTEKDSLRFYNLGDKYTNRIEHYGAKSAIKVEEPLIF